MKTSKVILLVDDVPIYNKLLELLIKRNLTSGYQIFNADNGKEAVDFCKSNQVDLIFMNIQMPVMDGFEATKIIKKMYPKLPIVAKTVYPFHDIKDEFKEANFNAYVKSPIREKTLKHFIAKYLS